MNNIAQYSVNNTYWSFSDGKEFFEYLKTSKADPGVKNKHIFFNFEINKWKKNEHH